MKATICIAIRSGSITRTERIHRHTGIPLTDTKAATHIMIHSEKMTIRYSIVLTHWGLTLLAKQRSRTVKSHAVFISLAMLAVPCWLQMALSRTHNVTKLVILPKYL